MILLILFAFIAGIVTILSPCILPILPIVLSSSVEGGKQKPLGVVIGFIGSFTFFTLFLSAIVKATGIPVDSLRLFSVVIIFLFGVSFLLPKVQLWLEQAFSRLARVVPQQRQNDNRPDFIKGLLIGLSLGLLWTPCVGPILASVISLALSGSVNSAAVFITLAYATGTAIPMFAVLHGGRALLQRHQVLVRNTANIQKVFGVIMVLTAIAIYTNLDRRFQIFVLDAFPNYGIGLTQFEDNSVVKRELEKLQNKPINDTQRGKPMFDLTTNYGTAPNFIAGGQWFNSAPLTISALRGKVVLVDFWTYTCINCIRTLPYLKKWHTSYKDKGLVIVGVHTPEFEFEKNP